MFSMMGCPPKRSALRGAVADYSENELNHSIGFKASVGKISVVEASNGEHANKIQSQCDSDGGFADADNEYKQRGNMKQNKRDDSDDVNFFRFFR